MERPLQFQKAGLGWIEVFDVASTFPCSFIAILFLRYFGIKPKINFHGSQRVYIHRMAGLGLYTYVNFSPLTTIFHKNGLL